MTMLTTEPEPLKPAAWFSTSGYARNLDFGKIWDLEFMMSGYTRVGLYASIYGKRIANRIAACTDPK